MTKIKLEEEKTERVRESPGQLVEPVKIQPQPLNLRKQDKEMSFLVYPFVNDIGGQPADRSFSADSGFWRFADGSNQEVFMNFYIPRSWELVSLVAVWHAAASSEKIARCSFAIAEGAEGQGFGARSSVSSTVDLKPLNGVDKLHYTKLLGNTGIQLARTSFRHAGSIIHGSFTRLGAVTEDTLAAPLYLHGFIVTMR